MQTWLRCERGSKGGEDERWGGGIGLVFEKLLEGQKVERMKVGVEALGRYLKSCWGCLIW